MRNGQHWTEIVCQILKIPIIFALILLASAGWFLWIGSAMLIVLFTIIGESTKGVSMLTILVAFLATTIGIIAISWFLARRLPWHGGATVEALAHIIIAGLMFLAMASIANHWPFLSDSPIRDTSATAA